MQVPADRGSTRFHFQNWGGANYKEEGTFNTICQHLNSIQADHAMGVEHNGDTTKSWVKGRMHVIAGKVFGRGQYRINAASTNVEAKGSYKPGGTMGITVGGLSSRILEQGQDKHGRWVYTKFRRDRDKPLTCITTYQVCQNNPKEAGPTTSYTQLYTSFRSENREDSHKVRRHHKNDLVAFVKICQAAGEAVIVAGDLNETIGDSPSGLTKLCSECNLVDAISDRHQTTNLRTYERGSSVIDYILVDPALLPHINRSGYEPFRAHINSDHRGAYVDFKTSSLFGSATIPMAPLDRRDYNSKREKHTVPYLEAKHLHLVHHNWYEKMEDLRLYMATGEKNHQLANDLYKCLIAACKVGGQAVPKFRSAPYSPQLIYLRNKRELLKLAIHAHTSSLDYESTMAMIESRMSHESDWTLPTGLAELEREHKAANKEFVTAVKEELKNSKLRQSHLTTCLTAHELKGNSKEAKRLRGIQRAEQTAKVFKKCAAARGLNKGGGLGYILVPEDPAEDPKRCTNWRRVDCQEEIVALLTERNQKHFGQSQKCNLTSPPLDWTMKFEAACHEAEAILTGAGDHSDLDVSPITHVLLDSLKYKTTPDSIPHYLSEEEFSGKIRAWDERTSTSPGTDMHLGHYKSYFAHHNLKPDSPQAEALEANRAQMLSGHCTLLNYALQFSHIYDSWKMVVNTMIEKEPGNPKIHRLRVIHLYEADYNLILAVKWRALLYHACDNGLVNESQFGSQPGKEALDAVFLRELEYELTRLTRKDLLHFDNDATSCYDRICSFLANIVSRKYGLAKKVCAIPGRTLEEARYHLKTKLGVSAEFVKHSRAFPWFGTGQGSGNSPMVWLFICSTLFDVYESEAQGARYESPDGSITTTVRIVGFVDDTRNSTNNFLEDPQPPTAALVAQATKDSQLWSDLLAASNQALELSKCGYHLMHYNFLEDGSPDLEMNPESNLTVTDSSGQPLDIAQWPNDKAAKYLGCQKTLADQKKQQQVLTQKCRDFARVIHSSHLNRTETQTFYWAIYKLSVGYPLPTCYFTKQALNKIQSKSHQAFVSKSGYNKSMPSAVMYAPHYMGGANFFHLYDDQGYGQIRTFLKFWRTPESMPGKLLRITMCWAQYCSGRSVSILEETSAKLHHFESKWLSSMRDYLNHVGGTIELDEPCVPSPMREGDEFLMDIAIESGKFKPCEIRRLNYCRLYMNVVTVSDISDASGKHIDKGMYDGTHSQCISQSRHHRVVQKKPHQKHWGTWKKALNLISHGRTNPALHVPLGKWLVPYHEQRRTWPFLHQASTDQLYRQTDTGHSVHQRFVYDFDDQPIMETCELPPDALPAQIQIRPNALQLRGTTELQKEPETPPPQTFQELVDQLDPWEQHLFSHIEFLVPEAELWHILALQKCYLVSDGSAKKSRGSFGWILSTTAGQRIAKFAGPAFGSAVNSYRAEGYGILSASRFILRSKQWQPPDRPLIRHTIFCDNESMIDVNRKHSKHTKIYPNSTMASEWDIIAEIRATMHMLDPEERPVFTHVKGHQDDNTTYDKLPLPAQLNVDADALAEQFLTDNPGMEMRLVPILPTCGSQVNIATGTITYDLKRDLKQASNLPAIRQYLSHKRCWHGDTLDDIDWTAHGRALRRHDKHRATFVKFLHNWLPVGKRVHQYDPKYPAGCPSCNCDEETEEHFFHCPETNRRHWRDTCLKATSQYLDKTDTPPSLRALLLSGLKSHLDNRDLATLNLDVDASVEALAKAQSEIGWNQVLKGRLSQGWQHAYQQHLGTTATAKKNGLTWVTGLIDILYQQFWDLWTLRNEDRHGRDSDSQARAEKAQVLHELDLLYGKSYIMTPEDQAHFSIPSKLVRMQWTTSVLRQWINSWTPVIERYFHTPLEPD